MLGAASPSDSRRNRALAHQRRASPVPVGIETDPVRPMDVVPHRDELPVGVEDLDSMGLPVGDVHGAVLTYKQFADMSYQEQHRTLKEMLGQAQRLSVWFNAVERVNLLPALQAMHDKVPQPGRREPNPDQSTWEQECRSLGIEPEQVRQWKRRTQAYTDIPRAAM